jgi:hypothetical protein
MPQHRCYHGRRMHAHGGYMISRAMACSIMNKHKNYTVSYKLSHGHTRDQSATKPACALNHGMAMAK